ncbi:hypothetical protein ACI2OX_04665 [Bacillus sp. N9]
MSALTKKETKRVKEFLVETTGGSKILSVYQGNIFEDNSDVIGLPVYGDVNSRGDLYSFYQKVKTSTLQNAK